MGYRCRLVSNPFVSPFLRGGDFIPLGIRSMAHSSAGQSWSDKRMPKKWWRPSSLSDLILLWHQPDRISAIELGSRERVTAGTAWQTASEDDDHSASLCGDRRGDVAFRT
jgi:hypothetical protein